MGEGPRYKQLTSFLDGSVQAPRALAPAILRYAETLPEAPESTRSAPTDATGLFAQIGGGILHPDGSVTFSAQTYGYLVGKLESLAETTSDAGAQVGAQARAIVAIGEALGALRTTVERASTGAAALRSQMGPLTKAEELARDLDVAGGGGRPTTPSGGAGRGAPAAERTG